MGGYGCGAGGVWIGGGEMERGGKIEDGFGGLSETKVHSVKLAWNYQALYRSE